MPTIAIGRAPVAGAAPASAFWRRWGALWLPGSPSGADRDRNSAEFGSWSRWRWFRTYRIGRRDSARDRISIVPPKLAWSPRGPGPATRTPSASAGGSSRCSRLPSGGGADSIVDGW